MSMANEIKNISEKDDSNFFVRFVKYFVPWKGDKSAEVVRKIVFIFSIFIFVFSINELTDFLKSDQEQINYAQEIVKYEPNFDDLNLNDVSGNAEDGDDNPESTVKERKVQSWAKELLNRNDEVVGWIKIPGFVNSDGEEYINFPVLQHVTDNIEEGNNYYLKRNIDEEFYDSGSIYADCVVPIDENGQADNITIYGHHMRRLGTSFTHLAEYKDGVDFLKKYPVIEFNTIYYECIIICCS